MLPVLAEGGAAWFTGDVERGAEALLAPVIGPVAVLKVPHHGSRTSSTDALVSAAQPRVAVISAGRRNSFGHPHPSVVARYEAAGVELLRTDVHGTIELVVAEGGGLTERHHRAGAGWSAWRALPGPDPP